MVLSYDGVLASRRFYESIPFDRRASILQKVMYYLKLYSSIENSKVHSGAMLTEMQGAGDVFKFRINRGERIIFSIEHTMRGKFLVLREYSKHDDQERKARGRSVNTDNLVPFSSLFETEKTMMEPNEQDELGCIYYDESPFDLEQDEIMIVSDEWIAHCSSEDTQDYIWFASIEQAKAIDMDKLPQFITGSAGTGKSTVLFQKLCRLSQKQGKILYITVSTALCDEFKRIYHKFKSKQEKADIYFLTLNDIFSDLLGDYKRIFTQDMFLEEFGFVCKNANLDPYIVWCEVEGILKSHLGITENSKISFLDEILSSSDTTLSKESYMAVNENYSYFAIEDRHKVYRVAEAYDQWLSKQSHVIDANQLAAQVIKACLVPEYDLIMIDEVQDFTELQLYMFMKLAKKENRIIFSGDINQNVRPTFFKFDRLYNIYYALDFKNAKENTIKLTKNYRSCREIVQLLNQILVQQRTLIGAQEAFVEEIGFRDGYKPLYFNSTSDNLKKILEVIYDKHYAIVVVSSEEDRNMLINCFPMAKSRIFDVQEIKGLEYDVVFTVNVTSAYDSQWKEITKHSRKHRQFFGYIYVAASRAKNHLIISEKEENTFLRLIDGTYEHLLDWDSAKVGLVKKSSSDDFLKEANRLDKAGLTGQAQLARDRAEELRYKETDSHDRHDFQMDSALESTSPEYEIVQQLTKKLSLNKKDGLFGVIDANKNVLIDLIYDSIQFSDYKDGHGKRVLECRRGNKSVFIDQNGEDFKQPLSEKELKREKRIHRFAFISATIFMVLLLAFLCMVPTGAIWKFFPRNVSDFIEGNIIYISAGGKFSAAITEDEVLWVWGDSQTGILGVDDEKCKYNRVMEDVAYVSAGEEAIAVIKNDGTLWTWGLTAFGYLGNGLLWEISDELIIQYQLTPSHIMDDVIDVSMGYPFGMAIKSDRTLWAWGENSQGQLGDGTTESRANPVKIMDEIIDVSVGIAHTLALKSDGTLWAWGNNMYGQLGNGKRNDDPNSTPQMILDKVTDISAGQFRSMAIREDGSVWVWGAYNQKSVDIPIKMSLPNIIKIASGHDFTLMLQSNGQLLMWKTGEYVSVEDEYMGENYCIRIMDSVIQVSALNSHFLVMTKDGSVWAWGSNMFGQLGDGTMLDSYECIRIYKNSPEEAAQTMP